VTAGSPRRSYRGGSPAPRLQSRPLHVPEHRLRLAPDSLVEGLSDVGWSALRIAMVVVARWASCSRRPRWADLRKKDFTPVLSAFPAFTGAFACDACQEMNFAAPLWQKGGLAVRMPHPEFGSPAERRVVGSPIDPPRKSCVTLFTSAAIGCVLMPFSDSRISRIAKQQLPPPRAKVSQADFPQGSKGQVRPQLRFASTA
jgi:hypothetical protein